MTNWICCYVFRIGKAKMSYSVIWFALPRDIDLSGSVIVVTAFGEADSTLSLVYDFIVQGL